MDTNTPPAEGGSAIVIDCQTCPARGRLCGDCFVPVLGRLWLETPAHRPSPAPSAAPGPPGPAQDRAGAPQEAPLEVLDSDELAAVSAFVRAGLVAPEEARAARAEVIANSAVG